MQTVQVVLRQYYFFAQQFALRELYGTKSVMLTYIERKERKGNTVKNDIYGEPEIIKYKNIIAKVYSPILTDEERERRMEIVKQAAVRLVLSHEETKGKKQ